MRTVPRRRTLLALLGIGLSLPALGADPLAIEAPPAPRLPPLEVPYDRRGGELYDTGWSIEIDNDALLGVGRDRDYTAGLVVTLSGRRAREHALSIDPALRWLDRTLGLARAYGGAYRVHSMQFGLVTFTPEDLRSARPFDGERPYASLLFLSSSQAALAHGGRTVYQSTLTLGLLGTRLAEWLQSGMHGLTGGISPRGYASQISAGGEPTARYALARRQLLRAGYVGPGTAYDLSWTIEGSAGYLTEGSVALSARWGRVNSPWWQLAPELHGYASQPGIATRSRSTQRELFVYAGAKLHARLYNVLLQGQFRDSAYVLGGGELERLIPEAWLGIAFQPDRRTQVSYEVRYQGREIERGSGARDLLWGGLRLSRHF